MWSRRHKARGQSQGQGHKKKNRGQGQTFRGQTLSSPRTGMFKAKDQGHNLEMFTREKKGLLLKNSQVLWCASGRNNISRALDPFSTGQK